MIVELSQGAAGDYPTGDALEQICVRNLLAASDEIIYFKDLDSRFVCLSKGCCDIDQPPDNAGGPQQLGSRRLV